MASFLSSFLYMLFIFMASHDSSTHALESQPATQFSSISAAPALMPDAGVEAPLSSSSSSSSPTVSPDISPLFPSPGGGPLSPSKSSLPTIPSSPSPPNPEDTVAPGPGLAFAPSGSLPVSHAFSLTSSSSLPLNVIISFLGLLLLLLRESTFF